MKKLTDEHIKKMQEGRRRSKQNDIESKKQGNRLRIKQLMKQKQRAMTLHDGHLLGIEEFKGCQKFIDWAKEGDQHIPDFCYELKRDEEYFKILDFLSEPVDGLPVVAQVGWKKPFTEKQAQKFIDKHEPNLIRLDGYDLCKYISENSGDGELRARCRVD